jgi:RNA polymerase-binding transcription factor DksA
MSSEPTTADLRAQLEAERDELTNQLSELGFGEAGGLAYDPNFADSSQVTAERGEAEALAANLKEQLEEVMHALTKMEQDGYGICEGCGQPIVPARLEAMPAARYCIECASKRR